MWFQEPVHARETKEGGFHERLSLLLLFHFSPCTNRNRIGHWMCTGTLVPLVAQKLNFLCGIFSYFLRKSSENSRCSASRELPGVYVQCARCKT